VAQQHASCEAELEVRMRGNLERELEIELSRLEALKTTAEKRKQSEVRIAELQEKLGLGKTAAASGRGK
jgi:hypothetical protein